MKKVTREFLEAGRSDAGGWNRKQLETLGVEWPPLEGWRKRLIGSDLPDEAYDKFLELRGKTIKAEKRAARQAERGPRLVCVEIPDEQFAELIAMCGDTREAQAKAIREAIGLYIEKQAGSNPSDI